MWIPFNRRDHLMLPTIVRIHGAFAESASWDGVVDRLLAAGHDAIAGPTQPATR
jgi:hypothetical protein